MKFLFTSTLTLSFLMICSCTTARPDIGLAAWEDKEPLNLLIVGGGGSPSYNQVSLEKNVQYVNRLLDGMNVERDTTLLYTGGNDGHRIVQTRDPKKDIPELTKLLASIIGPQRELYNTFRAHQLGQVDGHAVPDEIAAALSAMTEGDKESDEKKDEDERDDQEEDEQVDTDENDEADEHEDTAEENAPKQRLLMYYTGHGGPGSKTATLNTSMSLWNGNAYRVDELCKDLETLDDDQAIMLLMVQCFSGGFANFIFKEGKPEKGLHDQPRFGFFSTVHSRPAAGCTPDINEADYKEYSTYFLEALWGINRMNKKVESADYDESGEVSFDEAHAYSLIHSTTIDVSIKTSDIFLRHYSKLKTEDAQSSMMDAEGYTDITEIASAIDLSVLEGLSERFELEGDARVQAAKDRCKKIDTRKKAIAKEKATIKGDMERRRRSIAKTLMYRWPELYNPWHPDLEQVLKTEGNQILKAIKKHKEFKPFTAKHKEYKKTETEKQDIDREWAGLMRFVRTAENIALEHNLQYSVDPALMERFKEIKALEHQSL